MSNQSLQYFRNTKRPHIRDLVNVRVDINCPSVKSKACYKNFQEPFKFLQMRMNETIQYLLVSLSGQYVDKIPQFDESGMSFYQVIDVKKYMEKNKQLNYFGQPLIEQKVSIHMQIKDLFLECLDSPNDFIQLKLRWKALTVHIIGLKNDLGTWVIDPSETFINFVQAAIFEYNSNATQKSQIYIPQRVRYAFLIDKTVYPGTSKLQVLNDVYSKAGVYNLKLKVQIKEY